MILLLLLVTAVIAGDYPLKIPPVEVNIRALGAMIGKKAPPTDLWMAYELRPIWDIKQRGAYIGNIT
jgi:hypothetical protein